MTGIPTTVVVDVQNVYGLAGAVLGIPRKPTPDGIAAALRPYGFEVDKVEAPIGLPDFRDLKGVRSNLAEVGKDVGQVSQQLMSIVGAQDHELRLAIGYLEEASSLLTGSEIDEPTIDGLQAVNQVANEALGKLSAASYRLRKAAENICDQARISSGVPSAYVAVLASALEYSSEVDRLSQHLQSASSYAWAGAQNLRHLNELNRFSAPPIVRTHPGRFRPGFRGGKPDEKRIDMLCGMLCMEETVRAVKAGDRRAVVLISDDDDLTPAVESAARTARGSEVSLVVAGSPGAADRLQARSAPPERPRWIVLDQHAWHRIVGLDPVGRACARHQLARLALGSTLPFTENLASGFVATKQGLRARLQSSGDSPPPLPALLYLADLDWATARRKEGYLPTPVVTDARPAAAPLGQEVECPPAKGTEVALGQIPLLIGGQLRYARVPAPGWWMAGDKLIVAQTPGDPRRAGGGWRILGPGVPRTSEDLSGALRGRVTVVSTASRGAWAIVETADRTYSVPYKPPMVLSAGDEVVIVPYERSATRFPPRALLASSPL